MPRHAAPILCQHFVSIRSLGQPRQQPDHQSSCAGVACEEPPPPTEQSTEDPGRRGRPSQSTNWPADRVPLLGGFPSIRSRSIDTGATDRTERGRDLSRGDVCARVGNCSADNAFSHLGVVQTSWRVETLSTRSPRRSASAYSRHCPNAVGPLRLSSCRNNESWLLRRASAISGTQRIT